MGMVVRVQLDLDQRQVSLNVVQLVHCLLRIGQALGQLCFPSLERRQSLQFAGDLIQPATDLSQLVSDGL